MFIAVFRARVSAPHADEFNRLYAEMGEIVSKIDGYVSHKLFSADDGEGVVIAEFLDFEAVEAWDKHQDHKRVKELGKKYIFDEYDVSVGKIVERHVKP